MKQLYVIICIHTLHFKNKRFCTRNTCNPQVKLNGVKKSSTSFIPINSPPRARPRLMKQPVRGRVYNCWCHTRRKRPRPAVRVDALWRALESSVSSIPFAVELDLRAARRGVAMPANGIVPRRGWPRKNAARHVSKRPGHAELR